MRRMIQSRRVFNDANVTGWADLPEAGSSLDTLAQYLTPIFKRVALVSTGFTESPTSPETLWTNEHNPQFQFRFVEMSIVDPRPATQNPEPKNKRSRHFDLA